MKCSQSFCGCLGYKRENLDEGNNRAIFNSLNDFSQLLTEL